MVTVTSIAELQERIRDWRRAGDSIGLVPTMGALHDGHFALMRHCRADATRTCATIFVNPTQFGPNEDFASYPRTVSADEDNLRAVGVDLLFMPSVTEMYPPGHSTRVRVGPLGETLDGTFRPGHFEGIATVVTKLLLQALPDVAVFGEKDYQQLQVIKRMVRDIDIPVRIEGVPTVREPDGVALSSRNAYLTPAERAVAPALYRSIRSVAQAVAEGGNPDREAARGVEALERAGFGRVDYLTLRDAETLQPVADASRPTRVLAAAWLGRARLIDNVSVAPL
ncbi:MAG: pantoate--beta-alanine ligase [Gemmatimonadetes bacterium]|nr:pantoate--beta-alanine ligase [Gemmatimonadota bacterium]